MKVGTDSLLEFGPFRIDPDERVLSRDQQPVPLSPKAFDLLLVLVQRGGQVVTKDELMALLWPGTFVEESNIGQHVFQLRKALGENAQDPAYIVTVPGRGYRFVGDVRPARKSNGAAAAQPALFSASHRATWTRAALLGLAVLVVVAVEAPRVLSSAPPPKVLRVTQLTHSGSIAPFGRVLSDGARLYFTESKGGTGALAQAPVAGGEPTVLATVADAYTVYDIDAGRSRMLVGAPGPDGAAPLWVLPTTGGTGRRLGDAITSGAATWLPDGHHVLYANNAQVFRVGEDGADPARLLTANGRVTSLRASPDGRKLCFTVRRPGSGATSMWQSAADGSDAHPFALEGSAGDRRWGEGESCGDWSPDGKYFVFHSAHGGVESYWVVRKRGWFKSDPPVQIYTSPNHLGEPRFSPDAKTIFFVNYQERRELVRYDNAKRLFVPYLGGVPARFVSFSADGKWVAFRSETDGTLWRSRDDGSEKLQLTFPPMEVLHPTWSADGESIIFQGRLPGKAAQLYSVPSHGGTAALLSAGDAWETGPSESPDGRFLLFQRWNANAGGTGHSAVYELDLKSNQATLLAGSDDFDGVHWSPDGKYAAASDQGHHKLMLFDFRQRKWSELADGNAYGWGLRWSSDSRYVYYQHAGEGEDQPIFRVRVSDRKVETVTSARQIPRADVLGYTMTGLTPDGAPLASLVHRNSDIYALQLDAPQR